MGISSGFYLFLVFGIQNRYNAFNLVDDLIRPFRAFCDLYVKLLLNTKYSQSLYLTIPIKRDLVKLLARTVFNINKEVQFK